MRKILDMTTYEDGDCSVTARYATIQDLGTFPSTETCLRRSVGMLGNGTVRVPGICNELPRARYVMTRQRVLI